MHARMAWALGVLSIAVGASGCGSEDGDQAQGQSDVVEDGTATSMPAFDPALCPDEGLTCISCAEHLSGIGCPNNPPLCEGSEDIRADMKACTCDLCADECAPLCGDEHDYQGVSQACATCALELCNPEVSACANDTI